MSRWTQPRKPTRAHRRARRPQLYLELLEARCLLDASGLPVPGFDSSHVLVQFQEGGVQKVAVQDGQSAEDLLASFLGRQDVAYAELDYTVGVALTPNDPNYGSLYGLNNTGQTGGTSDADIDAPEAWNVTTGKASTVVGVIDTGIDHTHADLFRNIWINQDEIPTSIRANLTDTDSDGVITFWDLNQSVNQGVGKARDLNGNGRIDGGDLLYSTSQGGWADGIDQDPYTVGSTTYRRIDDLIGWDFVNNDNNPMDDHGHGTHVAGTIGAIGNNGVGVAGVNWKVQMAGLKFLSAQGSGSISNAVAALDYAVANGIKISNNSWGGGGFSTTMSNALTRAASANHVFVAAAGNSALDNDTYAHYPSSYTQSNVLAVASTDHRDALSYFSNYGDTSVDLAAPGSNIYSTVPGGYATYSGTSMATPHVAGVVALVRSLQPTWTATQVINRILNTVDAKSSLSGMVVTGGRLNAFKAVDGLGAPDTTPPTVTGATPNTTLTTTFNTVTVTFSEAINPNSFDEQDVTGLPAGWSVVNVAPVSSANTQFAVTFAFQTTPAAGTYTFQVGPTITDVAGNAMTSAYTASVTLTAPPADTTGPRVTSAVANSTQLSAFSYVTVTFSEALNPTSFTTQDVVPLTSGLTVNRIEAVGTTNTQFRIFFNRPAAGGTYRYRVGPEITDVAGNRMDQNRDGVKGDPYTGSVTLAAGTTYSSSPNLYIKDWDVTTASINVGASFTVTDLNVKLTLTHTWMSDLYVYLIAPNGSYVGLSYARGGSGQGFTNTVFDDEASTPIAYGYAPFTGSYRPEQALSSFDGLNAQGTWTLYLYDSLPIDDGYLKSWSLTFNSASAAGSRSVVDTPTEGPATLFSEVSSAPRVGSSSLSADVVPFLGSRASLAFFSEGPARIAAPVLRYALPPLKPSTPASAAPPLVAMVGGSTGAVDEVLSEFAEPEEEKPDTSEVPPEEQ